MQALEQRRYTIQEYLDLSQNSSEKVEYYDGEVIVIAGGTLPHSVIGSNMFGELYSLLKATDYRVVNGDARLAIESSRSYVFPDAAVVCGDFETSDIVPHAITNYTVTKVFMDSTSVNIPRRGGARQGGGGCAKTSIPKEISVTVY